MPLTLKDNTLLVKGILTQASVTAVWQKVQGLSPCEYKTIDLSQVTDVDSAGVAFLLQLLQHSHEEGQPIKFSNIPEQVTAIAELSGVAEFI